jgi:hypothetical protein
MKYALIILNLLAAAWIWNVAYITDNAGEVNTYSRFRELEHAGVINTNAMALFLKNKTGTTDIFEIGHYLNCAQNTRYFLITPATLVFLGNAVLIAIFWKPRKRKGNAQPV